MQTGAFPEKRKNVLQNNCFATSVLIIACFRRRVNPGMGSFTPFPAALTNAPLLFCLFQDRGLVRAQERSSCALPGFHSLPADKPVNVVYQKCRKAHHHRKIPALPQACLCPQHDQHTINERLTFGGSGRENPPKPAGSTLAAVLFFNT